MANSIDGGEFQKYCFGYMNFEILSRYIVGLWVEVMARDKHLVVIIYRWHGNGCHHWGMVVRKRWEDGVGHSVTAFTLKGSEDGGWAKKYFFKNTLSTVLKV